MQSYSLPSASITPTRIAYGCMPLGGSWDRAPLTVETRQAAQRALRAALGAGVNFFDHADIYCQGKSEEVFADLWLEAPSLRPQIYLQTKCGIRFAGDPNPDSPHRFDFSYEHILQSVEGSLRRLKTDYLDALLLHRPDPLVEPDEVARAFDALHTAGKVRFFGVSNHTAAQIALLQHSLNQPVVFNQVAFNVIHTHLLDEGIIFNQTEPAMWARNAGTIEFCRLHGITLQAWGPLAWGLLSGRSSEKPQPPHIARAAELVAALAAEKGAPPEAILIAWLLRHPAGIQPVVGSMNPERIRAACRGDEITLTREEWYALFSAGRGEGLP